jgi:hypothetical protein
LGDIFPNLSYPVVERIDRSDFDSLYEAYVQYGPGQLGDNATKDFVLLHVFEIEPKLIKYPADLLKVLLRRHFRNQRIPFLLEKRLIQILRQNGTFERWPLEQIVPDRNAFFLFLQERWPAFLDQMAREASGLGDGEESYGFKVHGPLDLPFDHDDVRVYMDNLFFEGLLEPVSHPHADKLSKSWAAVGIKRDLAADHLRRLQGLLDKIKGSVPGNGARYQEWVVFAARWAKLMVLTSCVTGSWTPELKERTEALKDAVDERFFAWMIDRFRTLHNQPPVPPVMIHHIPRAMARRLEDSEGEKIALVVVDGMAYDQWAVLRDVLGEQREDIQFRESGVFAWVPTVTSVSRQALFAGKPPLYFPSSIHTTTKESAFWTQFWLDRGLSQAQIAYVKLLGGGPLDELRDTLSSPAIRTAGVILDKVDKIMHGIELGIAGMHNQVRQWAQQGYFGSLINALNGLGFKIWVTSDHGNIEAQGCGKPAEGAIADLKGQRVRVYPDQLLRSKVKVKFPEAIEWPAIGLPEEYFPLLTQGRSAFVAEGTRTVAHGSISLEEVIVPFVLIDSVV